MNEIRVIVVDDEPLARERVRDLAGEQAGLTVVAECADGEDAVKSIRARHPDLVFLDVQMPGMDGFDVIRTVGAQRMPPTIFVTAYDRYALKAFEASALDYLLKPIDPERFARAVRRARRWIEGATAPRDLEGLAGRLKSLLQGLDAGSPRRLVIRDGGRSLVVAIEEIDWIEPTGNYLRLHVGRESHMMRETMGGIESRLESCGFVRIHRSAIVNVSRIREMHPTFRGDAVVVLRDGTRLPLGRAYRERVSRALGQEI